LRSVVALDGRRHIADSSAESIDFLSGLARDGAMPKIDIERYNEFAAGAVYILHNFRNSNEEATTITMNQLAGILAGTLLSLLSHASMAQQHMTAISSRVKVRSNASSLNADTQSARPENR
jgi:hypothetical protein